MKFKKMLSVLISAAMCVSALAVNANADNSSNENLQNVREIPFYTDLSTGVNGMENIKVVSFDIDKDKVNESLDEFNYECESSGNVLCPNITRSNSEPTLLHRLDLSNYSFSGSIIDGSGERINTDCYFVCNADGIIYVEGSAFIHEFTNQNLKVYLYDKTTGGGGYALLDDSNVMSVENGVRKRFYYNFGFINLDTTHEYYIGFGLTVMAANYDVWGVIAHSPTHLVEH